MAAIDQCPMSIQIPTRRSFTHDKNILNNLQMSQIIQKSKFGFSARDNQRQKMSSLSCSQKMTNIWLTFYKSTSAWKVTHFGIITRTVNHQLLSLGNEGLAAGCQAISYLRRNESARFNDIKPLQDKHSNNL